MVSRKSTSDSYGLAAELVKKVRNVSKQNTQEKTVKQNWKHVPFTYLLHKRDETAVAAKRFRHI